MARLPKKVNILGKEYAVRILGPRGFHGEHMAECEPTRTDIRINKYTVYDQKSESLLHEIIEAINWELGLKITERQLRPLSAGLFQVLRSTNPWWRK